MSNSRDDFADEMQEMLSLLAPLEVEETDSSRYLVAEYVRSEADKKAEIKKSLIRQITVEEAETTGWPKEGFQHPPDAPGWKAFKAQMQDGDELWTYSTVWVSHGFCSGREGYLIMRNDEVVDEFVVCIVC